MDKETSDDLGRLKTHNSLFGMGLFGLQPNFHDMHMVPRRKSFNGAQKAFKNASSSDDYTSAILIQWFLTGLLSPIRCQLLLHSKPETLHQAIKEAVNVEYALNFYTSHELENTQETSNSRFLSGTQAPGITGSDS